MKNVQRQPYGPPLDVTPKNYSNSTLMCQYFSVLKIGSSFISDTVQTQCHLVKAMQENMIISGRFKGWQAPVNWDGRRYFLLLVLKSIFICFMKYDTAYKIEHEDEFKDDSDYHQT